MTAKITLILTTSFKVLNMESKGLMKSRCFALLLVSIPKAKTNDIPKAKTNDNNSGAFASDEEELGDQEASENADNNSNLTNQGKLAPSLAKPHSISGILTKVDFVIQRIKSSSS
ncbi:hypothetical protein PGTUg99_006651 [Puccinia graminis f. sp. tritici]|uniref:Uncharacterized protein n=1 Tax=Puccinia graminis f. sp. tritici TaxID=56615 RepID=A0A5B0QL57_PUCGR|nr:hypothetical protein PGTUg99_006651 [Puccinia graminis f. sp. tritici]